MTPTDHTAWKGAIGVVGPMIGYMLSNLSNIKEGLQILSLLGGLIVCVLTIRSFIKNWDK